MMVEGESVSGRFDLSSLSEALYKKGGLRFQWLTRLVVVGFLAAVVAYFVVLLVRNSLEGSFQTGGRVDIVLIGMFGGLACLIYWTANFSSRQPATEVEITDEEVAFRYPTGSSLALHWRNPSFRLQIQTGRFQQETIRGISFWWHPRAVLTDEAVDAMVAAAKLHGLEVRSVKDPNSVTGSGTVIEFPRGQEARVRA